MSARTELLVQMELITKDEAAWRDQAACQGMGPRFFFPKRGKSAAPAKRVCATCPVWSPCLEFALAHHDRLSVAGGRSEKERRVILRARRLGIPGYGPGELSPPTMPPRVPHCGHTYWCDDWEIYVRKCALADLPPELLPPFAPRRLVAA